MRSSCVCASGLQVGLREAGACRFPRRQNKIRRRKASLHRPAISLSEPLIPVVASWARSARQIKQSAKHRPGQKALEKKLPQCMQNRPLSLNVLSRCQIIPQAIAPREQFTQGQVKKKLFIKIR